MYEASLRDSEGAETEQYVSGASLQQRCQFVGENIRVDTIRNNTEIGCN